MKDKEVTLYNAIFNRRSVRKYTDKLTDDIYNKLLTFISKEIEPLIDSIKYHIDIVDNEQVKTNKVNAKQFILFYTEKKANYDLNAGYIMQQIDLYLQSLGAGCCWLGLAWPKEKQKDNLDYVIMLSIGMSEKPFRRSYNDFKRKPLEQVGNLKREYLEAVRVAPSAMNMQPWYFLESDNTIDVYLRRKSFYKIILKKYDFIDIGISLFHLKLALRIQQKDFIQIPAKDDKNCIISLEII